MFSFKNELRLIFPEYYWMKGRKDMESEGKGKKVKGKGRNWRGVYHNYHLFLLLV